LPTLDLDSRKRTKSESTDKKPQKTETRKIQKTSNTISKPEQNIKKEIANSAPANTEEDGFSDDDLFDALVDEIDKAKTQKASKKQ